MNNKKILATSGYPRSGNTFLNHSLCLLFFPEQKPNLTRHTVSAILGTDKILVPFRNPIDCIPSWNLFSSKYTIDADVKFYIRFYSAVFDNLNKVILMDFDYFTKDIEYIKEKVFKNFGIGTDNYVTDAQIKEAMIANDKEINLPRNNQEELNAVKEQLVKEPLFEQCIELYNKLKEQ